MRGETTNSDQQKRRERLALLGLAADRQEPAGACPDNLAFAEMLEAGPDSTEWQRFLLHLSACESCYRKWLVLSAELELAAAKKSGTASWFGRRKTLTAVGSACALAVGVMLFLAIDYRPMIKDEAADSEEVPAPAAMARKQSYEEVTEEKISKPQSVSPAVKNIVSGLPVEQLAEKPKSRPERAAGPVDRKAMGEAGSRTAMREKAPAESSDIQGYQADVMPQEADQEQVESETAKVRQADATAPTTSRFDDGTGGLRSYIGLLQDFCADQHETRTAPEIFAHYARMGRELLKSEELSGGADKRKSVEEIVELMEKGPPIDDNALDLLCQRVRKFAGDNGYTR